jgi:deoxyribodipyrimidine photo-lyase
VPEDRIQACNARDVNGAGDYVLYWMIAARRRHFNFALQRAVYWAVELRKPLLIVEALSRSYPWASERLHTPILQGMANNLRDFEGSGVHYHPFVERYTGHGKGMIVALARRSCLVIADDYPAFVIPHWIETVAAGSPVKMEKIDSNGLFPMRSTDRVFTTAFSFRRFLQSQLSVHLGRFPLADPLADVELPSVHLPKAFSKKWPATPIEDLAHPDRLCAEIQVEREVRAIDSFAGGSDAARQRVKHFVRSGLNGYGESRNDLSDNSSSRLSPYLHFGHLSAHELFLAVTGSVRWSPSRIHGKATGKREGWWNAGPDVEAFLDQLITWRELGFNMCAHNSAYDSFKSLPDWAIQTLTAHKGDARPVKYKPQQFEDAATDDDLWNAAQTQLREEGRIHNYLRMLWGKKILEWSRTPEEALRTMIDLNNKYALDGRDPNSYTGIFWVLGRYDRPWFPERPIFGTVRYMSSANTARKMNVRDYLRLYSKECLQ